MPILKGTQNIARYMETSPKTLRRWIKHKSFPAKKIDKDRPLSPYYSHTESIDEWIKHNLVNREN